MSFRVEGEYQERLIQAIVDSRSAGALDNINKLMSVVYKRSQDEAYEEAARVADRFGEDHEPFTAASADPDDIAGAIRALKDKK